MLLYFTYLSLITYALCGGKGICEEFILLCCLYLSNFFNQILSSLFLRHVQQDCSSDVLSLLYVHNLCLVCMGVFAYVCIWFTHQSSSVMSLTWWGAQRGEATCVMCFRPLLESDVTRGEVSGWEWRPEESWGGGWGGGDCVRLWQQGEISEKATSQPESGLSASTGHPGQCVFNGRGAWRTDF